MTWFTQFMKNYDISDIKQLRDNVGKKPNINFR